MQSPAIDAFEAGELLASLADKSLVVFDETLGRYRLLETVRQYARDRLFESGEGGAMRERHQAFFLSLAEEAEPNLTGSEQGKWLDRLETEHDNLRSALEMCQEQSGDQDTGLRLASALWRFWLVRGHPREGRDWLSGLLDSGQVGMVSAPRAKALYGAGALAWLQGDYPAAGAMLEASLVIARAMGDRQGIAASLNGLGNVAKDLGDYPAARCLYEEALAIHRELGDRRGIASALGNLGMVATELGNYQEATALQTESLTIKRELGDRLGIGMSLNSLGILAEGQRDYKAAKTLQEESLTIARDLSHQGLTAYALLGLASVAREMGDLPGARKLLGESLGFRRDMGDQRGIADSLEGLAAVSGPGRAARIWGAAARLRDDIGSPMSPSEELRLSALVAKVRSSFGEEAFDMAWREGHSMTTDQAIEFAMEEPDS